MKQTWGHPLTAEEEPGRFTRGTFVEAIVSPEPLPDDLTGYFSDKQLNAFEWAQVTEIPGDPYVDGGPEDWTLKDLRQWLMPEHTSATQGRVQYSFADGVPQVGDTLTSSDGMTATVDEIVANNVDDALRYTGNPDDFSVNERIFMQSSSSTRTKIQAKLVDRDGNNWFRLDNYNQGFDAGDVFEGLKDGGVGTVQERTKINVGRVRLDNISNAPTTAGEPPTLTFSPSGVTAIGSNGEFRGLAKTKRLLARSLLPSGVQNQLDNRQWFERRFGPFQNLVRRHPNETSVIFDQGKTAEQNADDMDAATLDDDVTVRRRRRR